jgi:hypothetical protein
MAVGWVRDVLGPMGLCSPAVAWLPLVAGTKDCFGRHEPLGGVRGNRQEFREIRVHPIASGDPIQIYVEIIIPARRIDSVNSFTQSASRRQINSAMNRRDGTVRSSPSIPSRIS